MLKWLPAAAGTMLFASIACGQYKTNPAPATPAQQPAPAPTAAAPPAGPAALQSNVDPNEAARRLTREEAEKMVKQGKAVWVDVRGKDQYDVEHIKGAVSYPLTDLETVLEKKVAESKLPKHKFLITYCA
jgi:pyruvate/2-oxoglutarate dehydrogenase complex dihydrolipoamide acyltransferase (E2) component